MPSYSKYFRKKWRKYKKYRWKYRQLKYGKSSSVVNLTSRSRVGIKAVDHYIQNMRVHGGTSYTDVFCLNPFMVKLSPTNVPQTYGCYPTSTINSAVVNAYCKLYDEFKVDSVTVKITLTSIVGNGGDVNCVKFYTAWDRKGSIEDTKLLAKYPTVNDLEAMPSCQTAIIANNTTSSIVRSCKASDFFEKYVFCDCTCSNYNVTIRADATYSTPQSCYGADSYVQAGANMLMFCPTFYFGAETINYVPDEDAYLNIVVDTVVFYTFRNPKYAGSIDDSKTREKEVTVPVTVSSKEAVRVRLAERNPDATAAIEPTARRVRRAVPIGYVDELGNATVKGIGEATVTL